MIKIAGNVHKKKRKQRPDYGFSKNSVLKAAVEMNVTVVDCLDVTFNLRSRDISTIQKA